MAFQSIGGPGIPFPGFLGGIGNLNSIGGVGQINLTAKKTAFIGRINWNGRPGSAKTVSSSGGLIRFVPTSVTFATAGSTIRAGLQGVATGAGPAPQPDGSFTAYADLVQGTDTFTNDVFKTVTLASGTVSLTQGDLVSVVFDFTTRNGSDSMQFNAISASQSSLPAGNTYASGAWAASGNHTILPIVQIVADDGTLGTLDGTLPIQSMTLTSFNSTTTPNHYGLIFQVPFACKVDGGQVLMRPSGGATADGTIRLSSAPLGTPSSLASASFFGEWADDTSSYRWGCFNFASEVTLSINTDYVIAYEATGSGSMFIPTMTLRAAGDRALFAGGTNLRLGTRKDSGAYAETTTQIPMWSLRITALDDGVSSGGSSMLVHPGLQGGARG